MATAPQRWNDEQDEQLKKLTSEGLSASMIAARMPGNRSRNSIIGRQHRLRLMGKQTQRKKPARSGPIKPTDCKSMNHMAATSTHVPHLRSMEEKMRYAETSKSMRDTSELDPLMVPLLELESHQCRWPVNSPDNGEGFLFCGHKKQEGSSYCSHHRQRAYRGSHPASKYQKKAAA